MQFFQHQLDYIFFFYGLAFILLAAICSTIRWEQNRRLPWIWLALFGFTHGINEWLDMLTLSFGDGTIFSVIRVGLMTVSFVFLMEFGRDGLFKLWGKGPGRWIYIPLGSSLIIGGLWGLSELNATARYSFGLLGGLLSALALFHASKTDKTARTILSSAAVLMALYAIASGAIVAKAPFFPASVLNQDFIFSLTGIPIQLFRGILALLITAMIWRYHQHSRQLYWLHFDRIIKKNYGFHLTIILLIVLIAGWLFTDYVGRAADRKARMDVLNQTTIAAAALNTESFMRLTGTTSDMNNPDYTRLRKTLMDMKRANPQLRWLYTMFLRRGKIPFVVDSVPEMEFGHADPGVNYMQPPKELFDVFTSGRPAIVGPYTDEWGSFVSGFAAIRDPTTGRIIAVLGIDINASEWQKMSFRERLEPIYITLLLALLFIGFFMVRQRMLKSAQLISISEKRLAEAQRVAHVGSWTYSPITKQMIWSEEMFRIFEQNSQNGAPSYLGLQSLIHSEDRISFDSAIQKAVLDGEGFEMELRIIRPDGRLRHVLSRVEVRIERNGEIIQVMGIAQDISEQKNIELQLHQSQKMEAVGQLAGGIAHDFNNILTAIIGYISLMRMKMEEADPLQHYAEQILSSSEKAAVLTQSLLAFSRKQMINPQPVDLNDVLKNGQKLLRSFVREDIEFVMELCPEPFIIMADSIQLEQVFMNLVANARDAMPDGGTLAMRTEIFSMDDEFHHAHGYGKPGTYAILSVTDTGTGIDEKTRDKIFEPFFTTKEIGKGTGLGLAMVYGIIKQHDGYINVYSEPGLGTTFRIYLPLVSQDIQEIEKAETLFPTGDGETVLLAEDSDCVRKSSREILENYGYAVIEATDGEDAIEKFTQHKDQIGILVLDVVMPKKSGKEVYDIVKSIRPDMKVLFTSGYTADIITRKGILEDKLHFIAKPVLPIKLLTKIKELLNN
jgi:signal transduction histidine kinase/CheY-like chemotaxis protein